MFWGLNGGVVPLEKAGWCCWKLFFGHDIGKPYKNTVLDTEFSSFAYCWIQGLSSEVSFIHSFTHAFPHPPFTGVSCAKPSARFQGQRDEDSKISALEQFPGLLRHDLKWLINPRILDFSKSYCREKDNYPMSLNLLPALIDLIRWNS